MHHLKIYVKWYLETSIGLEELKIDINGGEKVSQGLFAGIFDFLILQPKIATKLVNFVKNGKHSPLCPPFWTEKS